MNAKNGNTGQMRNRTRGAAGRSGNEFGPAAAGFVGVDMMFPFLMARARAEAMTLPSLSQRGEVAQEELRRGSFRTLCPSGSLWFTSGLRQKASGTTKVTKDTKGKVQSSSFALCAQNLSAISIRRDAAEE
jgi:hypothetical protein